MTSHPFASRSPYAMALASALLLLHLVVLYWPRVSVQNPVSWPHTDKVVHVVIFLLPALALAYCARRWWIPLGLLAVHAPLSEWVQGSFLPARSMEGKDVVADLVGVAVAAAIVAISRARQA